MADFHFPSKLSAVSDASQQVLSQFQKLNLDEKSLFNLKLCFEEAFINAVKYGNKNNPKLTVDVKVLVSNDSVEMIVQDQGEGFDHNKCADPTKNENLAKPGGRGVYLIKKLMDEVAFTNNGSSIHMKKQFKTGINGRKNVNH